jgi:hypothetical protein
MTWDAAERLARVLLFEGYALYPYRADSTKNQKRWALGTLWPGGFARDADRSRFMMECIVTGRDPRVRVAARFLHAVARSEPAQEAPWFEALERSIEVDFLSISKLGRDGHVQTFDVEATPAESPEPVARRMEPLFGRLTIHAAHPRPDVHRLRVELVNENVYPGDDRDEAYPLSLGAAHLLLEVRDGAFISLLEPPEPLKAFASSCNQEGLWPVLVGGASDASTLLASPIILYDYPQIAPESPQDLCDSTEIDEILALRILTMTEQEKEAARATDERVRAIIDRTERLTAEELSALHGTWREGSRRTGARPNAPVQPGERVRLRPAAKAARTC